MWRAFQGNRFEFANFLNIYHIFYYNQFLEILWPFYIYCVEMAHLWALYQKITAPKDRTPLKKCPTNNGLHMHAKGSAPHETPSHHYKMPQQV